MMANNTHCGHTAIPAADLTCRQVTALLVDYVAGDMGPLTHMAFKAHLRHCSACTAFLATYRETIRATRTIREETIPAELLDRVRQFLHRQIKSTPRNGRLPC